MQKCAFFRTLLLGCSGQLKKTLSETDVAAKAISGLDGWINPGGVKYRAAYAANNTIF